MSIVWAIILLICGLLLLWKSADWLVSGAIGLANNLGISPLVIGLTVVAMGTSAPEVAASIAAAARGAGDVAIGNIYGSNIANLALVGGLCAAIRPIRICGRMLRREIPVMLMVGLLLWPILQDLYLSRTEGVILLTVFAGLMAILIYLVRKEKAAIAEDKKVDLNLSNGTAAKNSKNIFLTVAGLAGLALGADIAVRGAITIGEQIGLSKAVIGLTIIAIGTSLPELITCLAASLKGQDDISIGNLVGSNVFNTLLVSGTAGVVGPFEIAPRLAAADYWIMICMTGAFAAIAISRKRISRAGGFVLLCGYAAYMVYLLAFTAQR